MFNESTDVTCDNLRLNKSIYEHKTIRKQSAIVTGASRGIGQAIALAFAREGAHVVSVDIGDQSETGAKAKALGAKFNAYTEDFGKLTQKGAAELIAKIVEGLPAAWTSSSTTPASSAARRLWTIRKPTGTRVLQINLSAPFFLTQAVGQMVAHRRTRKIPGGRAAQDRQHRLDAVVSGRHFRARLHRQQERHRRHHQGVRQRTGQGAHATSTPSRPATSPRKTRGRSARTPSAANPSSPAFPKRRWGQPEDIAEPILFLASKDADYMNGTIMNVDGGWLAR